MKQPIAFRNMGANRALGVFRSSYEPLSDVFDICWYDGKDTSNLIPIKVYQKFELAFVYMDTYADGWEAGYQAGWDDKQLS